MVAAWIVLALGLLAFEVHHLAFYALFGALGAFGAAFVALMAPSAYLLQATVAVGVSIVGIGPVRPYVSRVFARRHDGHVGPGVHGGLVGQEVITLDQVGEASASGHVRLAGERWLAVSGDDRPIPSGTPVVVTAVRGTTLVVWPLEAIHGTLPPTTANPSTANLSAANPTMSNASASEPSASDPSTSNPSTSEFDQERAPS